MVSTTLSINRFLANGLKPTYIVNNHRKRLMFVLSAQSEAVGVASILDLKDKTTRRSRSGTPTPITFGGEFRCACGCRCGGQAVRITESEGLTALHVVLELALFVLELRCYSIALVLELQYELNHFGKARMYAPSYATYNGEAMLVPVG